MKKIVPFEADKTRNIKFGVNQIINLEKRLGKPISSLVKEEAGLETLRAMLYVGLVWEDESLTEEHTGELIDMAIDKFGFKYVSEKIGEAMQQSFGEKAVTPSTGQ